jgi:phosphoesterase RecJ-like protein
MRDWLKAPPERIAALRAVLATFDDAHDVVLTTHVNADGDGTGSEIALAEWLRTRGTRVHIVNPTPFPDAYRFLLPAPDLVIELSDARAAQVLAGCDTVCVLDTGEVGRIGKVASATKGRRVVVIDHHLPGGDAIEGVAVRDASACATGELVYDLIALAGDDAAWTPAAVDAAYTAILSDTGSFRFANSTPRAHALAADLIARGVDPESIYRRVYATVPLRRIALLRHALENLEVDPELPLAWITIDRAVMEELGCTVDDLEGVVEHARSIEGTEVAVLFRGTRDGATKVSLRSSGDVDVNAIARRFNGGGHAKASGAVVGLPVPEGRAAVLGAIRDALRQLGFPLRAQA